MSDALLLAWIQECVRSGHFLFTVHALTTHPVSEDFQPHHAVEAILNGRIIEHYSEADRCLICGTASGIGRREDLLDRYIHCVVDYVQAEGIVIITMYRPSRTHWESSDRRKRKA